MARCPERATRTGYGWGSCASRACRPAARLLAVALVVAAALAPAAASAAPGDLDPSFDGDGKRTIDYGGSDVARALALRPDGRIVIGGSGNPLVDFAVQSLLPDGSGDPSSTPRARLGLGSEVWIADMGWRCSPTARS